MTFRINGETLVRVKGGAHLSGGLIGNLSELGLATGPVRIFPRFTHRDVLADDFGPFVPADIMWMLADVRIEMTLVHYDPVVLDRCLVESMAGCQASFQVIIAPGTLGLAGTMSPAGTMMGGMKSPLASGNHFISLNLASPVLGIPWRFRSSYLIAPPFEIPLGTEKSAVMLNWRAIPYAVPVLSGGLSAAIGTSGLTASGGGSWAGNAEIYSSGAVLWDYGVDT